MLLSIPLQIMKMQNNLLHTYKYGNKNTNTNSLDTVKVDFERNVKTSTNDKKNIDFKYFNSYCFHRNVLFYYIISFMISYLIKHNLILSLYLLF